MGTRLSILFVTAMYPHAERPGYGAFVMQQAAHLRALGHGVDVVDVRGYESPWNYFTGALHVLLATRKTRYDVVHAHYGLTGACALLRWRTPLVVTFHGSDVLQGTLQPFVSRLVSKIADATIAVSPEIARRCRSAIVPCGVDLERFTRTDKRHARQALGLPPAEFIVLFPFDPARPVKRFDLAEAAVDLLRARGRHVCLLPVWKVANDRMPLYYSAADVMILCSDTEGSPTSLKEALGCDLPVVSTDVGDVRAILDGIEGAEICDHSAASLAAGLERALEWNRDGRFRGRGAMRRFDAALTARALVDVYRTVLRA